MSEPTSTPKPSPAAAEGRPSPIHEAPAFFRTLSGPTLAGVVCVVALVVFGLGYLVMQSLRRPPTGAAAPTGSLTPPSESQFAGQLQALEARAKEIQARQKALDDKLPPALRSDGSAPPSNPFEVRPPEADATFYPPQQPASTMVAGRPPQPQQAANNGPTPLARAQASPLLSQGFTAASRQVSSSARGYERFEGEPRSLNPDAPPVPLADPAELADTLLERFSTLNAPQQSQGHDRGDAATERQEFLRAASERPLVRHTQHLTPLATAYTLLQGSVLPAILEGALNSDLPGQTTALLRRNVYDSATGQHLLVPRGSRLIGSYDSRVVFGQRRVLVAWERLLLPSGSSLDLHGMPGVDGLRAAGLSDRVNNHFLRLFGNALVLSVISAGAQLSQPQQASSTTVPSASQIAAAAVGQELSQVGTALIERQLNVPPTLEVRPGYQFNVELTADLVFDAPLESAPPVYDTSR